jgi:hypothetical protein
LTQNNPSKPIFLVILELLQVRFKNYALKFIKELKIKTYIKKNTNKTMARTKQLKTKTKMLL